MSPVGRGRNFPTSFLGFCGVFKIEGDWDGVSSGASDLQAVPERFWSDLRMRLFSTLCDSVQEWSGGRKAELHGTASQAACLPRGVHLEFASS